MKRMYNYASFIFTTIFLFSCGITEKERKELETRMIAIDDSVYNSNQSIKKDENILHNDEINKKPTDANLLLKQIQNKKTKVLFHGIGTEPFWDLYITEKEVLYSVNEENTSFILLTPFDKNIKTQKISYKSKENQVFNVTITKEPAGDGMSERTYPYTVIFSETERHLNGAGDSKLMSDWSEYER